MIRYDRVSVAVSVNRSVIWDGVVGPLSPSARTTVHDGVVRTSHCATALKIDAQPNPRRKESVVAAGDGTVELSAAHHSPDCVTTVRAVCFLRWYRSAQHSHFHRSPLLDRNLCKGLASAMKTHPDCCGVLYGVIVRIRTPVPPVRLDAPKVSTLSSVFPATVDHTLRVIFYPPPVVRRWVPVGLLHLPAVDG